MGLDVSSFSEIDDGRKCLVDRYAAGIPIVAGTVIDPQFLTAAIRTVDSPAGMRLPVVRENDYDFDPAVLSRRGGAYLYGFWQSWKYFNDISGVVRNWLSAASLQDPRSREFRHRIMASNSVAVHVRRGDYLVPDIYEAFGLCELPYYSSAFALLRERIAKPTFFIFSDDPHWCRSNFTGADFIMVSADASSVHDDLILMAHCRHHIIANSSLSWWGAWLGSREGSIAVAPVPWYTQSPHARDLIPDHWIRLNRRSGAQWRCERGLAAKQKISVVVLLAHNEPEPTRRSLENVRSQTYSNLEIILVLSNPTSHFRRAITDLVGADESIRTILSFGGRGTALNAGIAAASGDWIAFLEDCDQWRFDKLQTQIEAAYLDNANMVGCRTVPIAGPSGVPPLFPPPGPPDRPLKKMLGNGYAISGISHTMVRRDVVAATGGFSEQPHGEEDEDFWRRMSAQSKVREIMLWDRLVFSPKPFITAQPAERRRDLRHVVSSCA